MKMLKVLSLVLALSFGLAEFVYARDNGHVSGGYDHGRGGYDCPRPYYRHHDWYPRYYNPYYRPCYRPYYPYYYGYGYYPYYTYYYNPYGPYYSY